MEWTHFNNALWLLLIIPAAGLLAYQAFWRRKWLSRLAEERFLGKLVKTLAPQKQFLTTFFFLLSLGLLAAGLLNPARPDRQPGGNLGGYEVGLVLDVSNSMLAQDVVPNRLDLAKLLAQRLTDTLQGSRLSAVVFAGEAWLQLPPTTDIAAARSLLRVVGPRSAPVQGTNLEAALNMALETSEATSTANRAIILMSDGEELEGDLDDATAAARERGVMIIAVMLGTEGGAIVTDMDGATILNEEGAPVVSRANPEILQKLAAETKGKFITYTNPEQTLNEVLGQLDALQKAPLVNSFMVNMKSYSPVLFILSALSLLAALFIPVFSVTEMMARRKMKRESTLLPRTAMVALLMMWIIPSGLAQATATPQRAEQLLRAEKLDEARGEYEKLLQQEPANWKARLHLGNIFFRQEEMETAATYFGQAAEASGTPEGRQAAYNNLGLALARMGKADEAITAFTQALKQAPADEEVIQNLQKAISDKQNNQSREQPKPKNQQQNKPQDESLKQLRNEEEQTRRNRERLLRPRNNPQGRNW